MKPDPTRSTTMDIRELGYGRDETTGKLAYSRASIRDALGEEALGHPPSFCQANAETLEEVDPARAAAWYLAAALASAGLSRPMHYEDQARRLAAVAAAQERAR